jgi:trehalose 6-phosphate synthase
MALGMLHGEQRARMRLMRGLIQEFNVFRWAGRMLIDAAGMRRRGRLLERAAGADRWRITALPRRERPL